MSTPPTPNHAFVQLPESPPARLGRLNRAWRLLLFHNLRVLVGTASWVFLVSGFVLSVMLLLCGAGAVLAVWVCLIVDEFARLQIVLVNLAAQPDDHLCSTSLLEANEPKVPHLSMSSGGVVNVVAFFAQVSRKKLVFMLFIQPLLVVASLLVLVFALFMPILLALCAARVDVPVLTDYPLTAITVVVYLGCWSLGLIGVNVIAKMDHNLVRRFCYTVDDRPTLNSWA